MTYEVEHPASLCKSYEILRLTKWCILRPNPLLGVILPFLWRTAVSRALTKRIQRCVVAAFGRTSLRRICRAYFTGASPCGRLVAAIRVLSPLIFYLRTSGSRPVVAIVAVDHRAAALLQVQLAYLLSCRGSRYGSAVSLPSAVSAQFIHLAAG